MLKNTTFTLTFVLCATLAQAQNLNEFNDVRTLGVLLNPAHIGKEDAKGELNLNAQANGNYGLYTPGLSVSLNYVHYLKLKNNDGLNIGLIAENQGFSEYFNTMNGGLNVAYIHNFDAKNALSGGVTANIVQGRLKPYVIQFDNCFNGDCDPIEPYSYTFLYPNINLGLVWKNKLSENANLSLGFAVNNVNSPTIVYYKKRAYNGEMSQQDVITVTNYTATFNTDFMVSKVVGFAPILFYKTGSSIYPSLLSEVFGMGSDIRFKLKGKHEIRLGALARLNRWTNTTTYNIGYQNAKINVGLSYGWLYSSRNYNPYPVLQTNFQYAF